MSKDVALIIDDITTNRAWLKAALGSDFSYLEADSFEDMRKHMAEPEKISVVILNLNFHANRGFEVLFWFKDHKYMDMVPVIVIQERFDQAAMDEAYELGAQDCLYYPLAVNQINHRVRSTIRFMARLKEIQHRASHDELTGAVNRSTAMAFMMDAIERNPEDEFFMAMIDLDFFKHINDTRGHVFGDKALVYVYRRIIAYVGKEAIVSRYGGDEFIVFAKLPDDIESYAKGLKDSITWEEEGWPISASIGFATTISSGKDREQLFKDADCALFYCKGNGRNQYAIFNNHMLRNSLDGIDKDARGIENTIDAGTIIRSFEEVFEQAYYIDLRNNVAHKFGRQAGGNYDMGNPLNALDFMGLVINKVDEAEKLAVSEFINIRTLALRLETSQSISMKYKCAHGDILVATYSVCKRDDADRATGAILYITHDATSFDGKMYERVETDMCVLNGLKQYYNSIWLIDPENYSRDIYFIETDVNRFNRLNSFFDGGDYFAQFSGYVRRYVIPEQQEEIIAKLAPENLFRNVPEKGTYVIPFERTTDGVTLKCEYIFSWGKYGDKKLLLAGYRHV